MGTPVLQEYMNKWDGIDFINELQLDEMDYILAITNHVDTPDCIYVSAPEGMMAFTTFQLPKVL